MKRLYLLLISTLTLLDATAQADTAFVANARKNLVSYYNKLIEDESALYTGTEYRIPVQSPAEYPYFNKRNSVVPDEEFWKQGYIVFNQERYTDISILYDVVQDMVIIENAFGDPIMLVKDKVSAFSLGDTRFVQIRNAEKQRLPRDGFYEVLYDGATRVVGRHSKTRQERIENRNLLIYYPYKQRYFLLRNGLYYSVSKKGDVLKLMQDRRQEMKAFIREQKLRVTRKNPDSFAQVAAHYDALTVAKP